LLPLDKNLRFAMESRWMSASVRELRQYSLASFGHDLLAGVIVGLVALPLAS
jgi:MFS superfamily sulfate permease-like transporter